MAAISTDRDSAVVAPGALPGLVALAGELRRLVKTSAGPRAARELLLLLDFGVSHHGGHLLDARDEDDLDDRLEALLAGPDMFHWSALVTRAGTDGSLEVPNVLGAVAMGARGSIGEVQARSLGAESALFDACVRAQRARQTAPHAADSTLSSAVLVGPAVLKSPSVPPEIAGALAGSLEAAMCLLAIDRAVEQRASLDPWLSRALVARLLHGLRRHAALLAALVPSEFPAAILAPEERLDLPAILERHRRAPEHAEATYQEARARLAS